MLLPQSFLKKYDNLPFPGTKFGEMVFLRTYSRWLPDKGRRETWAETVRRVVEYSMSLYSGPKGAADLQIEAMELFDNIFNLRLFPAGRTLWVGGTKAAEKFPLGNFNCSFLIINSISSFRELFYLLMVGAGVGFRVLPEDVIKLGRFSTGTKLLHKPYSGVRAENRRESTLTENMSNGNYIITVGDSKEGWVTALEDFLILSQKGVHEIEINYDNVRPRGEMLKTFGGRASGHTGLQEMFTKIHKIIINSEFGQLSPLDCLDICNIIGEAIVVGGVRRTSEMALFSIDDPILDAKYDLWTPGTANHGKTWRSMSNNTIFFKEKPTLDQIKNVLQRVKNNGEPGFINVEAASRRRPNFQGINPCVTEDTWVYTDEGQIQVKDLIGVKFNAKIDNDVFQSTGDGFFYSGFKPVYLLKTKEGFELKLTNNHKILKANGEWVEAGKLIPGDKIVITRTDKIEPEINDNGWLLGELVGDGTFGKYACLDFWGDTSGDLKNKSIQILDKKRKDLTGTRIDRQNKWRVQSKWLTDLAEEYGITRANKFDTTLIERESDAFIAGYIRGLFDSDGTIIGTPQKGVSIRLTSIHIDLLKSVQRMLLRFGIYSRIYENRRPNQIRLLPDGKGGMFGYNCQALHELVISKDNLLRFRNNIGFYDQQKAEKLNNKLAEFNPYATEFTATFTQLVNIGEDAVYDCTIPGAEKFVANGVVVHNCAEILLDDKGVCNLTTVNVRACVSDGLLNMALLVRAIKLATRIGMRQTNVTLELPTWDGVQKRDRLIGVSLTGWMDAMDAIENGNKTDYQEWLLAELNKFANAEAMLYASEMRIPVPLLVTAVKPEGTISQLPTVSSGAHRAYAPYFIRRVRITSTDPLARVMKDLGYPVYPENGTKWKELLITKEVFDNELNQSQRDEVLKLADTWVIEFPIKSDTKLSANDEGAVAQFARYLRFQKYYSDHNTSITITVGDNEWDTLAELIYEKWDEYVAVSFLPRSGGNYPLMPYEEIDEEEYNRRIYQISDVSITELLTYYENNQYTENLENDPSCSNGACPIR